MTYRAPQGYTLLEMIVAVAIFSMVMLMVTGVYVTLISLDRQARAESQLSASLSFSLENMARTIRTGTDYCGSDLSSCSSTVFWFRNSDGMPSVYRWKDISDDGTKHAVAQCISTTVAGTCSDTDAAADALTDPRIDVTDLTFSWFGTAAGDQTQPRVTFVVRGTMPTDAGKNATFSVETTATSRQLDL